MIIKLNTLNDLIESFALYCIPFLSFSMFEQLSLTPVFSHGVSIHYKQSTSPSLSPPPLPRESH